MGNTHRSKAYRRGKHTRGFWNCLIGWLRQRARKRGHEWTLTRDEAYKLLKQDCYLCGAKPSNGYKHRNSRSYVGKILIYQGLDRVNSDKGYTPDNTRPCCAACNQIKSDRRLSSLKRHLNKMIKFSNSKKPGVFDASSFRSEIKTDKGKGSSEK